MFRDAARDDIYTVGVKLTRSIAAAQTVPVRGDVDANIERHVRLIRAAVEARARVLVFPELSLTPPSMLRNMRARRSRASAISGRKTQTR